MADGTKTPGFPAGPATDIQGLPVLDPTKNVLDLVEAAIRRQDDLRQEQFKRADDLRSMEAEHYREIGDLRHDYERELREAESARLDSIRAVDQAQVQRTADVQAQVASTLAAQVVAQADAFRVSLRGELEPIRKDIADLRRTQYEQAGGKAQSGETRLNLGTILGGLSVIMVLVFGLVGLILAR